MSVLGQLNHLMLLHLMRNSYLGTELNCSANAYVTLEDLFIIKEPSKSRKSDHKGGSSALS